jgi:hypothetical protein
MIKASKSSILFGGVLLIVGASYVKNVRDYRKPEEPLQPANPARTTQILLNAPWLKHVLLGYENLYGDALSFSFTHALANHQLPSEALTAQIPKIAAYRPRHEEFYLAACQYLMNVAAKPQECLSLTMLGLQTFPQSWRIPLLQGFVHANKLKQPAQAAAFYALAGSRKNSPPWVVELSQTWQRDRYEKQ